MLKATQKTVTLDDLHAERALLDAAQDSVRTLILHLQEGGLPNHQKNQATLDLVRAGHWIRDAQDSLTEFTKAVKAADEKEKQPELKLVPEPVIPDAPAAH